MRDVLVSLAWVILAAVFSQEAAAAPACLDEQPDAHESYAGFRARNARADCLKPWTILVYMAADNDLVPDAFWDLYEMEAGYKSGRRAAGSTARSDLLVQLAAPGLARSRRLHIFQQQNELYDDKLTLEDFKHRTVNDIRSPVAELAPRSNPALPDAPTRDFESFVEWGIHQYPAEHYLVVVWGHGQGWAPAHAGEGPGAAPGHSRFGGLAFSDSKPGFLDIPGLHQALREASQAALGGRPLDVYVSDACLMQMTEVATEIADSARFIAGSAQIENYLGLPYRRMMFELNTNRFSGERARMGVAGTPAENDEPFLLARMLPRIFRMSLEEHGLHGRAEPRAIETVTMSSISSSELTGGLLPALGRLGRTLQDYLAEKPLRAIALAEISENAPSFLGGTQDLGGFLALLLQNVRSESPAPSPAAQALENACTDASLALERAVVAFSLGTLYTARQDELFLKGIRAVSIWLPASREDFGDRIEDFASSEFYRQLGADWRQWLRLIYGD